MLDFQSRPTSGIRTKYMNAFRLVSALVVLLVSNNEALRLEFSAQSVQLKVSRWSSVLYFTAVNCC